MDKRFQPVPVDAGDELFPNGIFEFNITKLLQHIKSSPNSFPVETVSLAALQVWSSTDLDEATIQNADVSLPIVLAEISPGRFNVIDGRDHDDLDQTVVFSNDAQDFKTADAREPDVEQHEVHVLPVEDGQGRLTSGNLEYAVIAFQDGGECVPHPLVVIDDEDRLWFGTHLLR